MTELTCGDLESGAGFGTLSLKSDDFGSFGELRFWEGSAPPDTRDPTWISVTDTVTFGDTSANATFEVVEFVAPPDPASPFGNPVGPAALEATLTPTGGPERYAVRSEGSNQKVRRNGVIQEFTVAGTLHLPMGITFDLSSCAGQRDEFIEFSNAPASSVSHDSRLVLECEWNVDGTSIRLLAKADELETGANVLVETADATFLGATESNVTLTTESFAASLQLEELGGTPAGSPVGTALASATFEAGGRINERNSFPDRREHITGTSFLANGAVAIATPDATYDLPMNAESCLVADQRVTEFVSARNNPGGSPLDDAAMEASPPPGVDDVVSVLASEPTTEPDDVAPPSIHTSATDPPRSGQRASNTVVDSGGDVTVDAADSDSNRRPPKARGHSDSAD